MSVGYTEQDECWHLLVKTVKGDISILKNLDAQTARKAYQRLMPRTRPIELVNREQGEPFYGGSYTLSGNDISFVDVIGPDGIDLEPWKGVAPLVIDNSVERERVERAKSLYRAACPLTQDRV